VSDAVEFLGWLEYRQALGVLTRCDVGLVPHHATASWQTTIPNKLFDYMSLGKPVVVSDARPTARIVTEERCGVVFRDRDPASLAEAIVALTDPTARVACGDRGRAAIQRRYNWEAEERRLHAAIQRVTGTVGYEAEQAARGVVDAHPGRGSGS